MNEPVIAALSTAWGEGGISIVRVSGTGSVEIVDSIFRAARSLSSAPPRYMALGHIEHGGCIVDQVLAVRFEAGKSYTGEESAEIHCHGGVMAAQMCLDALMAHGASHAAGGEFTRRAFVNGRIDLSQAESVLAIIRAQSASALRCAARSLQGETGRLFELLLRRATLISAHIEAVLDYPEEEVPPFDPAELCAAAADLTREMEDIRARCMGGIALREGLSVCIAGRPNVGKSSLLNAIVGQSRAIVTPIPGTTRDVIDARITHRGVPLRFIDTAGIRTSSDTVEAMGIERARASALDADVRIWALDGSVPLCDNDRLVGDEILACAGPSLISLNKCDLPLSADTEELRCRGEVIHTSATTGTGLATLKDRILQLSSACSIDDAVNLSRRQIEALDTAITRTTEATHAAKYNQLDAAAASLEEARHALARITGTEHTEELLNTIFSQFCIGK